MRIRPVEWRDLPALHRCRAQSVFLHTSLVVTWGPLLISGALLSTLAPAMGIYTSLSEPEDKNESPLFGQTIHTPGAQNAQLTFLAPETALETPGVTSLLEHLSGHAVGRGAFRLLADADERLPAFEMLRQWGFAIYARQRIWRLKDAAALRPEHMPQEGAWRPAEEPDLISVRSLYNNLIPGLVQQVEPFPAERLHGYVYRLGDDLQAFVEFKYGHRGIWAQPFIHPDAEDISDRLAQLLSSLPNRLSRPVYLCVRSYQSWLESAIEALGAEPSPRQAMMVKHLALPQKALRAFALPALEGGRPEVSAPISHSMVAPAFRRVKQSIPRNLSINVE
jgi:hypothetical protein